MSLESKIPFESLLCSFSLPAVTHAANHHPLLSRLPLASSPNLYGSIDGMELCAPLLAKRAGTALFSPCYGGSYPF